MKGLSKIPTNRILLKAYNQLQVEDVSESDLALMSQWSRFDPRLGEKLVSYIMAHWKNLSPVKLNLALKIQPWPAVFGVIIEFVRLKLKDGLFQKWAQCVVSGLSQRNLGLFFIGTRKFGGKLAFEDASQSTSPYLAWGYLGREDLFNKSHSQPHRAMIPRKTRIILLREFIKKRSRFTVNDYIEFLGNHVSRRQAERDLLTLKTLKKLGSTRGRTYRA